MDKWKLEPIAVEEEKKQQALQKIGRAVGQKKEKYVPSWWNILWGQVKFTSKYCLAGQFLMIVLITLLFEYFAKNGAELGEYLGTASAFSAFSGIFLIQELSRSQNFGMVELEQTCYLSMKQLWCMKMILFGSMDILILSIMMGRIAVQCSRGLGSIGIYLLVPFVMANVGYLLVFSWIRGNEKGYVQTGLAAAVSILSALLSGQKEWYDIQYIGIWTVVLIVSSAVLAVEILRIYGRAVKGEIACWN